MDGFNNVPPRGDPLESSAFPSNPGTEPIDGHFEATTINTSPQDDPFNAESLVTPLVSVDDVNPSLLHQRNLLASGSSRPRHPSGMLMGPDDPLFQELRGNLRTPNLANARYDVIGPFGQEPDPDIDVPRENMPFPRPRNQFPPPGGSMYGGNNSFFGPII